jgi:hypothetical protein
MLLDPVLGRPKSFFWYVQKDGRFIRQIQASALSKPTLHPLRLISQILQLSGNPTTKFFDYILPQTLSAASQKINILNMLHKAAVSK